MLLSRECIEKMKSKLLSLLMEDPEECEVEITETFGLTDEQLICLLNGGIPDCSDVPNVYEAMSFYMIDNPALCDFCSLNMNIKTIYDRFPYLFLDLCDSFIEDEIYDLYPHATDEMLELMVKNVKFTNYQGNYPRLERHMISLVSNTANVDAFTSLRWLHVTNYTTNIPVNIAANLTTLIIQHPRTPTMHSMPNLKHLEITSSMMNSPFLDLVQRDVPNLKFLKLMNVTVHSMHLSSVEEMELYGVTYTHFLTERMVNLKKLTYDCRYMHVDFATFPALEDLKCTQIYIETLQKMRLKRLDVIRLFAAGTSAELPATLTDLKITISCKIDCTHLVSLDTATFNFEMINTSNIKNYCMRLSGVNLEQMTSLESLKINSYTCPYNFGNMTKLKHLSLVVLDDTSEIELPPNITSLLISNRTNNIPKSVTDLTIYRLQKSEINIPFKLNSLTIVSPMCQGKLAILSEVDKVFITDITTKIETNSLVEYIKFSELECHVMDIQINLMAKPKRTFEV